MAAPVDGPGNAPYYATWGSIFDCLKWRRFAWPSGDGGLAEATTTEETLIVTGKNHTNAQGYFEFSPNLIFQNRVDFIIDEYHPWFIGGTLTPGGQSFPPPTPEPPLYRNYLPCPPVEMSEDLIVVGQQYVDPPEDPTFNTFWYPGIDGIDGFIDQASPP